MTREPNATAPDEPAAHPDPAAERWADRRLRDFFHREMPAPWPAAAKQPAPMGVKPGPKLATGWSRSHLALAASLLLLILGIGFLSRSVPGNTVPPGGRAVDDTAEKLGPNGEPIRPTPPGLTEPKPMSLELPWTYGFTD